MSLLDLKPTTYFLSTADPIDPRNTLNTECLVLMRVGTDGVQYLPYLNDSTARRNAILKPFKPWGEQSVIKDKERREFTRRSLILSLANQDGGAHVDTLKADYAALTRHNSIGWNAVSKDGTSSPIAAPYLASMRQITHEILCTFAHYHPNAFAQFEDQLAFHKEINVTDIPLDVSGMGRNVPYPCGSGRKYKKCHGR